MRVSAPWTFIVLVSLAASAWMGCKRDAQPPQPAKPAAEQDASPQPTIAPPPPEPTARPQHVAQLIERFAAANTLSLRVAHVGKDRRLLWEKFDLRRPGSYHITRHFLLREVREISDGETRWVVERAKREYSQSPVQPGEPRAGDLLPELFRRAPQILSGEGEWATAVAKARLVEETTIDDLPCEVVEIGFDQGQRRATIWLSQHDGMPQRVRETTAAGNIEYRVANLSLDASVDDANFVFTPGPDWKRID